MTAVASKKLSRAESKPKKSNNQPIKSAKGSVETDPFLIAINGAYENTKF
jgi:hypothetical protein